MASSSTSCVINLSHYASRLTPDSRRAHAPDVRSVLLHIIVAMSNFVRPSVYRLSSAVKDAPEESLLRGDSNRVPVTETGSEERPEKERNNGQLE